LKKNWVESPLKNRAFGVKKTENYSHGALFRKNAMQILAIDGDNLSPSSDNGIGFHQKMSF